MDTIYVIGHQNPDTDTVISAIAMAQFLNLKNEENNYVAARAGDLNTETEYVLSTFEIKEPELLTDATEKKLFLVDHNEKTQIIEGAEEENVLGIVDHHKINFASSHPIDITIRPWGCTATIIYDMFSKQEITIPEHLKPAILSAILSDTVILRSPTTTNHDREVVEELASSLDIDYQELGMEMFKAKAKIADKTPEQIIHNDFKVFEFGTNIVGVGQIETPDLGELNDKIEDITEAMEEIKEENGYHSIVLMLTDIIQEGTKLLIVSDEIDRVAGMFETTLEGNLSAFIPGMMSRKKQVAPILSENI